MREKIFHLAKELEDYDLSPKLLRIAQEIQVLAEHGSNIEVESLWVTLKDVIK